MPNGPVTIDMAECCCQSSSSPSSFLSSSSPESSSLSSGGNCADLDVNLVAAQQSICRVSGSTCDFCCPDPPGGGTMNGDIDCTAATDDPAYELWWVSSVMGGIGDWHPAYGTGRCLVDEDSWGNRYYAGPNFSAICVSDGANAGLWELTCYYYTATECSGTIDGPKTTTIYRSMTVDANGALIGGPFTFDLGDCEITAEWVSP